MVCARGSNSSFRPLEKLLLSETRRLLIDPGNTDLVVDDDLISSRAKDVQCKTLSQRKAGK